MGHPGPSPLRSSRPAPDRDEQSSADAGTTGRRRPAKKERDARKWVERRAVRCYLLLPESRGQLAGMECEVPPYSLAWDLIRYLESSVEPGLVSAVFGSAIRSLPDDEFHELRSLLSPVPEVLTHVKNNSEREIADTIQAVASMARKATAEVSQS